MKHTKILILIFCFIIKLIYSYKLLTTLNHTSAVFTILNIKFSNQEYSLNYLASGSQDLKIWDIKDRKLKFSFDESNGGHLVGVNKLEILENGFVASASDSVKIWDLKDGKLKYTFDQSNGGHSNGISSLVSLENGYLASGSYDKTIKIWDLRNGKIEV